MIRLAPLALLLIPALAHAVVTTGKARIDLVVRKPTHLLGENVLVDFCVVNTDTKPITIDQGGDYRGSSRSLRFKLEVRDARGVQMPDPDPDPVNFGGMGNSPTIAPGKRWCASLQLARYARIDAPGAYTVIATHDLGWPAGTAPSGKVVVTFAMPTPVQAEQVIAAMEKLPTDPSTSSGDLSKDFADFSSLRYEVYVAPLLSRASKGSEPAIVGLSEIPTPAATRALVGLIANHDARIARAAIAALSMRLPDPALNGQLDKRNPFENALTEQRKFLSKAWVPALADDVRAVARKQLASTDSNDQQAGAFMLEAVGVPADAPDLVKAMDKAIELTRKVPAETNTANLAHSDVDVQVAAAELALRGRLVALTKEVVKAMSKATGLRLNIISNAAYVLGARGDRVEMLLVRLSDKAAFDEALGELVDLLEYQGRSGNGEPTDAQRAAVVPAWNKFVARHRADIEAGKKISLTDPSVTPDLIPPTWKLGRMGRKGDWP